MPKASILSKIIKKLGYEVYSTKKKYVDYNEVIKLVKSFTLTEPQSIVALVDSVKYVVNNKIPGSIVECGVWRGGSMMAIEKTLLDLNQSDRELYLFDTYEGMTKPTNFDRNSSNNQKAIEDFKKVQTDNNSSDWVMASIEDVEKAVYSVGYDKNKIHFIKGLVEHTIPDKAPKDISLLRLDTDWYESTSHELVHLFPRISNGGVIIVDDYDHWTGSKKAVDEYISNNNVPLLLNRIQRGGRIGIKVQV